jgi:hypothetical protein
VVEVTSCGVDASLGRLGAAMESTEEMRMKAAWMAAPLALGLAACDGGADGAGGAADAAHDASDAGGDALVDAGGSGDAVTGGDVTADAAADASADVTADAAPDAASDAAEPDADATSDAGGTDGDSGGGCTSPLDQQTLDQLTFGLLKTAQIMPGQTRDFDLGLVECCYTFEPVDACVEWSVTPIDGVTIDAQGLVTVSAAVPNGAQFTVTADVEQGRRVLTLLAYVYTAEGNPFVGHWTEKAQLDCEAGAEGDPGDPINELRFDASGDVWVTWYPFEVYYDWWGTWSFSLEDGTIEMAPTGGNYVPDDVDGVGTFTIDGNSLILKDIWLGSYQGEETPPGCGHRFER